MIPLYSKTLPNITFEPMFVHYVNLEKKNNTVKFSIMESCLVSIVIEIQFELLKEKTVSFLSFLE